MISGVLDDLPICPSSREGEVVQAGNAEHGVVDAVTFEAAVAEGSVVFLFPSREFALASLVAVRDD
jgi:hypothetical protein